jgi:alpha-glucosidase
MNLKLTNIPIVYIFILFAAFSSCQKHTELFTSPDSNVEVELIMENKKPTFNLKYNNNQLLHKSQLGLLLKDTTFGESFIIAEISKTSLDKTWKPVISKVSSIRNNYNQWSIILKETGTTQREFEIIFRLYNDGVAFRYNIPAQVNISEFEIIADKTTLNFASDVKWWSGNDENENLFSSTLDSLPLTVKTPLVANFNNSAWMAFCEGAIYDYSDFIVRKDVTENTIGCEMSASKGKTDVPTSWRVVQLGKSAGALLESNILDNLNPECKISDTSWIKTGKAMWDWRVWTYKAHDGFEYGLNTESHKRFVDFAAKNRIKYLLIDADWYGPEFEENSDPTKAKDGIDIQNFLKYADEKEIKVILYLNDVGAKKYGLETILSQFHDWGAAGIKYGFMEGSGQEKVLHTREVTRLCAKYQLLVNFHDLPIPPSGDTRTWPNLIAREYCHAQADAKRSYWPETAVSAAFVNMLTGPLDMTNGWYDLNSAHSRERVFQPIPGTVAAENAKLVVYSSGLMILPDAPEEYEKKADLFEFIKNLPDSYDKFKVLGGTPDTYISVARKKGDNWYLGNLTNQTGRSLNLSLDFLDKSKKYNATIYEDAPTSHFINNKESYQIRHVEVTTESVLKLTLAPGGGSSVVIEAE